MMHGRNTPLPPSRGELKGGVSLKRGIWGVAILGAKFGESQSSG